jgi:hypothetical protein
MSQACRDLSVLPETLPQACRKLSELPETMAYACNLFSGLPDGHLQDKCLNIARHITLDIIKLRKILKEVPWDWFYNRTLCVIDIRSAYFLCATKPFDKQTRKYNINQLVFAFFIKIFLPSKKITSFRA